MMTLTVWILVMSRKNYSQCNRKEKGELSAWETQIEFAEAIAFSTERRGAVMHVAGQLRHVAGTTSCW